MIGKNEQSNLSIHHKPLRISVFLVYDVWIKCASGPGCSKDTLAIIKKFKKV